MTHFLHLEENTFSTYIGFNEILISNISSSPISIKVDGSPSIVFGFHNNEFFVGTKSVFNKTGNNRYYSLKMIDENVADKELAEKLKACFVGLFSLGYYDKVYQADLIGFQKVDCNHHTPNLLTYQLPHSIHGLRRVAVAIHTAYTTPKDWMLQEGGTEYVECELGDIPPQYTDLNYKTEYPLTDAIKQKLDEYALEHRNKVKDTLVELNNNDIFTKLQSIQTKGITLQKYFNYLIKNQIEITDPIKLRLNMINWYNVNTDVLGKLSNSIKTTEKCKQFYSDVLKVISTEYFLDYLQYYIYVCEYKQKVIDLLNENIPTHLENHIGRVNVYHDNIPFTHEGFVVNSKYGKVKLINRNKFSYLNFQKYQK